MFYTGTRYGCYGAGLEREVSQDARWQSACTELVREARASVIRLRVSIAMFRLRISFMRLADEKKKKKHSVEYFFLDGLCLDTIWLRFRSAQTAFR